jgi:hypothetical protein
MLINPGCPFRGRVVRGFWSSRSPFGVVLSYPLCVFSPRVILVSDTYVAIVLSGPENKSAVRRRHKANEHHDEWELGIYFIMWNLLG